MLKIFRSENAQVTVLGIGQRLAAQPQDAKLILDGGHELGNHTWSHPTPQQSVVPATRTATSPTLSSRVRPAAAGTAPPSPSAAAPGPAAADGVYAHAAAGMLTPLSRKARADNQGHAAVDGLRPSLMK